jgi:hypothetical protein
VITALTVVGFWSAVATGAAFALGRAIRAAEPAPCPNASDDAHWLDVWDFDLTDDHVDAVINQLEEQFQ